MYVVFSLFAGKSTQTPVMDLFLEKEIRHLCSQVFILSWTNLYSFEINFQTIITVYVIVRLEAHRCEAKGFCLNKSFIHSVQALAALSLIYFFSTVTYHSGTIIPVLCAMLCALLYFLPLHYLIKYLHTPRAALLSNQNVATQNLGVR